MRYSLIWWWIQVLCDKITYLWGTWYSMHAWAQKQVCEQVDIFISSKRQTWLPHKLVIYYHLLFWWMWYVYHLLMVVCSIYTYVWYHGSSWLASPLFFGKRNNHDTQMINKHKDRISQNLGNLSNEISVLRPYANEWFPPDFQFVMFISTCTF